MAFVGFTALATSLAAGGAVIALRYFRGSFTEARRLNRLTLHELHSRVKPRIAFLPIGLRAAEPPIAVDAGLRISGNDDIHDVDLSLSLGDAHPTCEPEFWNVVEPGTQPVTVRWSPTAQPRVGKLQLTYTDALGRLNTWVQVVVASSEGLKTQGAPTVSDTFSE